MTGLVGVTGIILDRAILILGTYFEEIRVLVKSACERMLFYVQ